MQKPDFGEALDLILAQDSRFHRDAYYFLRDALDYTVNQRKKAREGVGHVTGQQLLKGIRQYALKEFGPMVPTVLEHWGVTGCEHFGEMVFALISVDVFGKSESDSIADFREGYSFHEAFVAPYLPEGALVHPRLRANQPAEELS
ncbi:MAG: hypothetical protein M3463_13095 [Verrucomicrobiota bacterium]|nr:hypothetical protein [Verrucomicrobiota bacterium]